MEDFTPEQIVGIATGYRDTARALNEFQVMHWPEFTFEQHLDLNAYQNSLLNRAQDLQTLAVRPAFSQADEMAMAIRQATEEAKAGLKRIHNLTVALNVGAITVALASYVARANLRGIQTALRELGDLLALEEGATS
jgi:hypothetical protein